MMRLGQIRAPENSSKKPKRVGRGGSSGHGNFSGKGAKGQKARSGRKPRQGFEGGQMPLQRRIPKRGFVNIHREEPAIVNVSSLNGFEAGTVITPLFLKQQGLVKKIRYGVKILGDGKLNTPLVVKVNQVSKGAALKIQGCGGQIIPYLPEEKGLKPAPRLVIEGR